MFSWLAVFMAHQNEMMGMFLGSQLFFFKLQVPKVPPEVWLCPALRPSPTGLPHPHRVWGQRLPGAVLSNTRFTFSLLLNYLHLPFDQQFILRNNVILVLYNSTFLVDCCVEFCEKYLRKGLYCINKLFVCCELWHPISVFFCNLPSLHTLLFSASRDLEQLNLTGKLNATVFWVVGNIFSLLILRHWQNNYLSQKMSVSVTDSEQQPIRERLFRIKPSVARQLPNENTNLHSPWTKEGALCLVSFKMHVA